MTLRCPLTVQDLNNLSRYLHEKPKEVHIEAEVDSLLDAEECMEFIQHWHDTLSPSLKKPPTAVMAYKLEGPLVSPVSRPLPIPREQITLNFQEKELIVLRRLEDHSLGVALRREPGWLLLN